MQDSLYTSTPSTSDTLMEIDQLVKKSNRHRLIMAIILVVFLVYIIWFVPWIPALNNGSIEVTRLSKNKEVLVEVGPAKKDWIRLSQISPLALKAIITAEDGRFFEHSGFDFEQIRESLRINYKKGRFVRGGSTISQQLVKIAFLSHEKTIIRKLREAIGTVWLESELPKHRILEWYINLVEFGLDTYGIGRASWAYFGKAPRDLTLAEGIYLAIILPNPQKWSTSLRQRKLTKFAQKRFLQVSTNMWYQGYISEPVWEDLLEKGDFGIPINGTAFLKSKANNKEDLGMYIFFGRKIPEG